MEYSGAGGKLIHEKNQRQKISWHCPFKKTEPCLCEKPYYEAEPTSTRKKWGAKNQNIWCSRPTTL